MIREVKVTFSRNGCSGDAIIKVGNNPENEQLFKLCSNSEFLYDVLSPEDTEKSFFFEAFKEDGLRRWVAELDGTNGQTFTIGGDHSDIIYELNLISIEILK
ncbi:MAG: hypothetical protein KBT36_09585 [Kurthia sp.]|nr:hypothetical protein [Candidatus Kurthia equi]